MPYLPDVMLDPAQATQSAGAARAQLGWEGAPLGAVLHPPDDRLKSPAQVGELAVCLGPPWHPPSMSRLRNAPSFDNTQTSPEAGRRTLTGPSTTVAAVCV